MLTVCPLPAALTAITAAACPVAFDQIVQILFQQRQSAAPFTSVTIKTLATWTPLLAASDATKVVKSPIFAEMVIPQSEALLQGGNDNTTFNGIPVYGGEGSVQVTAQIANLPSAQKSQLRALVPFALASSVGVSQLTAYFVTKDGNIIHNNGKGFPIYNFTVSSVGSEGFNAPNKTRIGFSLEPNWDDAAEVADPSFDPLTELV